MQNVVFTGNLVHGLLRAEVAAAAPGRAWWIADSRPYALSEVLATVRKALTAEGLGVSGTIRRIPRLAGALAAAADGVLQGRDRYVQSVHVPGELKDTIACDIGAAQRELGYEPATTLLDGLRASVRWCVERGHPL